MGAQPRSTADSTISTDGPINSDSPINPDSPSSLGSDGATPGPGRETEQPDLFDE